MGINLDKIRARKAALDNNGKKGSNEPSKLWRSGVKKGDKLSFIIRFVSTEDGDPFKDLHFHYGIDKKSILCPKRNFDEECPICETASSIWRQGADRDDEDLKRQAKEMFVKQRFFAPVIVRGQLMDDGTLDEAPAFYMDETGAKCEHPVRWYGFGKKTYEDLIQLILNPEYGDITDIDDGIDFTVTFDFSTGKSFAETTLVPKRKSSKLFDNKKKVAEALSAIPDIYELYERMSPEEVRSSLEAHLNVTDGDGEGVDHVTGQNVAGEGSLDDAIAKLRKQTKSIDDSDTPF